MAIQRHLETLSGGVSLWNMWRTENPNVSPDLRGVNLRKTDLSGADLSKADLSKADLSQSTLDMANLCGANLCGVDLSRARLREANLFEADLSGADLSEALMDKAVLRRANLQWADLSDARLQKATLQSAILKKANLTRVSCKKADFSYANLAEVKLVNANLNGAILTNTCLWETQRSGWNIKGVICASAFWDEKMVSPIEYSPGEFERLYSEDLRIQVKYPGGISAIEIVILPAFIQNLENAYPDYKFRLQAIEDAHGGAIVTLLIKYTENNRPAQLDLLREMLQEEAEQRIQLLRNALEERESFLLKDEIRHIEFMVNKILPIRRHQAITLYDHKMSGINVGNTYNVSGQAGAVGANAHAQNMTSDQISSQIEKSMSLSQLANELSKLRQAMKNEATDPAHDIAISAVAMAEKAARDKDRSRIIESLSFAGKWALEIASKIGGSVLTEAIKKSIDIK
jgi:uncharacterized protein YjbI with pentapeptide repeats